LAAPANPRADQPLVAVVRDKLAEGFAAAVAADAPAVVDLLEQQLQAQQERAKWRPLREGIALMEELRPRLAERVAFQVRARFNAKLEPGSDNFSKTTRFSLDSLSLVGDDDIQEEIELGNATKRLAEQSGDDLFALTSRFASLLGQPSLPDDRNPVFPRVLARALLDVLGEVPNEAATRIAVFTSFSPVLLNAVPALYEQVNQLLKAHGILPDLVKSYGTPMQRAGRAGPSTAALDSAGLVGDAPGGAANPAEKTGSNSGDRPALTGQLDQMFATAEARQAAAVSLAAPAGGAAAAPGMISVQIRPELLAALRALESRLPLDEVVSQEPQQAALFDTTQVKAPSADPVRRAKQEMREALTPADGVVADIVAALFDRLFADSRLPDAIKVQVSRLQLPVFKAVMQDRTFLSARAHPIRRMIDTLAQLGANGNLVRVDKQTPEDWVKAIVEELLARGTEPDAYDKAELRLAEVLERFHEAALAVDDTVRLVRANEDRLIAVQDASLEVAHRLSAGSFPEAVTSLLQRSWRDVLVHDHVNGGIEGAAWKADLQTLDELLWSLTPHSAKADRAKMVSLLPSLLHRLHESLTRAGVNREQADRTLEELEHAHADLARAPAHTAALSRLTVLPVIEDDVAATLVMAATSLPEEWLQRGSWIEFNEDDGSRRRYRLNWTSSRAGICVFKDLEHNKSFAISLADLRSRHDEGTAIAVDGPGVADAAVEGAIQDVAKTLGGP
jgi:hypothetical protein